MTSLKGVTTVTVGRKRTNARYFTRDVDAVHRLLAQLCQVDQIGELAGTGGSGGVASAK